MKAMKVSIVMFLFVIFHFFIASTSKGVDKPEISMDDAIRIANDLANTVNYNTTTADIEVLKVKNGKERGPIRLVWLMRYLSKDELPILLTNDFFIIYFYPKGLLEGRKILGGGFCALVELYSGNVLFSFEDQ